MAKKKKEKSGTRLEFSDIVIAFLLALAGGVAAFTVIAVAGSIMFPDAGKTATADQPPAQTVRGTLPSRAPGPTATLVPVEPSEEPSNEPEPEPSAEPNQQTAAPTQTSAPAQTGAPSPTPTPTPTRTPTAQTPAPAVSIQPVAQTQAPAQSGNGNSSTGGTNGNWGQSSVTNEITGNLSRTAYWVSGGQSYHFSADCPSLARSTNIQQGTLQDALNAGKTDPCNNCAGGS